jgi:hypothetical protein
MAKAASLLLALVPLLAACDDPGAIVLIEHARASRDVEGRAVVDVDLIGIERAGGNVGVYCVSAHFFAVGVEPAFLAARYRYLEAAERGETCARDLEDGDTRAMRFVSSAALPAGTAVRVQVVTGNELHFKDVRVP